MKYNKEHIDIKFALINVFMTSHNPNIVDISYTYKHTSIVLQIVLLEGSNLGFDLKSRMKKHLPSRYEFDCKVIIINKDLVNKDKYDSLPTSYKWLENVLLSKNEID